MAIALAALLVAAVGLALRFPPKETKLSISKETSYITGPIGRDGSVDYVAAIDRRCRDGVDAENNASVLLWQALGPLSLAHDRRDAFFQSLGIPTLPELGDYFVPLEQFAIIANVVEAAVGGQAEAAEISAEALKHQLGKAVTRPWTSEEFGTLAEWLQANAGPLELVVQASQRPRRYDPLVLAPEELYRLVFAEMTAAHNMRALSDALAARAMHRTANGRVDEAWHDLLAVHRLARLAAQGPTLIDSLVAMNISGLACAASCALLEHGRLGDEQIAGMRGELEQLRPLSQVLDKIDVGERIAWLDSMARAASLMSHHAIDPNDENLGAALRKISAHSVDWNQVSREINTLYDRYVAAGREIDRGKRVARLALLDEEIKTRADNATTLMARIRVALGARRAATEYVSMAFCTYSAPAMLNATCDLQDRRALEYELTKLAFALAAYWADHGRYPDKLADLVPQYIATVPLDVFTGSPVLYTLDAQGYILRSNGPDGKVDAPNAKYSDDVIVRMPRVTLPREP